MTNILVTGAGGFIGRNLCVALAGEGYRVTGVDPLMPADVEVFPSFTALKGDIRDRALMARLLVGTETVFNLAAAHLSVSLPEKEYEEVNVTALSALVDLAREGGVKRFVHVSSVGVYGSPGVIPADETTPCVPVSVYGRTKLAGEKRVLANGKGGPMGVVVIRPAWVYGPHCPRTLKIARRLHKKTFPLIGRGENLRHPLYIGDLISALKLASEKPEALGRCFVIAGERAVTTRELLETFSNVLGVPGVRVKIPYWMGCAFARGIEGLYAFTKKEPPVSRRSMEFFGVDNAFDISLARDLLGFRPQYTLEQGLLATRGWLRDRGIGTPR